MLAFDLPLLWNDPAGDARQAEAQGFDGVWSTEAGHDPYLPVALAAAATERVLVGTGIAVAFPRSPMAHAQVAWDLHRMAPGRFVLGLGAQVKAHNQRRYSAPYDHPVGRMRDMVRAIRAIWRCWQDGEPLNYQGEFYQHSLMTPFFNPGAVDGPPPPIFIAAVSEPMLKVAGAECEGVHVHPLQTVRALDELTLPIARQAAQLAGRDPAALQFTLAVMIATGRTRDDAMQARDAMRAQVAFYGSTPQYRHILDVHGKGDVHEQLHALSRSGGWTDMPQLIDDELLEEFCVVAPWDAVAEEVVRRFDGRVQRVMPYASGSDGTPWASIAAEVRQAAVPAI